MRIILYILAGILLSGCLQKEPEIYVLQTESWTDLMPGTPGKTYLQVKYNIANAGSDSIGITGIKIIWTDGKYELKEGEFEYNTSIGDSNNVQLALRGVFLLDQRDIDTMNAEVEFSVNNRSVTHTIEKIAVEKVY
jgi:hypothetical protein